MLISKVIMMVSMTGSYSLLVEIIKSALLLIGRDVRHNNSPTLCCLLNLA